MNTQNTVSHKNLSQKSNSISLLWSLIFALQRANRKLNLALYGSLGSAPRLLAISLPERRSVERRSLSSVVRGNSISLPMGRSIDRSISFTTRCKDFFVPVLVLITAATYSCKKDSEKFESLQKDADIAYFKEDFNGAFSLYSQALEVDSDSIKTMITLGKIHYNKRNFEKAEEMFQDAIDKDECNSNAALWLSRIEIVHKKDKAKAKERLQSVVNRIPNRWEVEYTLGAILESEGNIEGAISLYNQAKVESAKLSLLYLRLGKIYRKAQRKETADLYFERARLFSEEDPNLFRMIDSEIIKEQ
ncbi:Tetratricopeptide repeat protein [Leptospira santarosai]|uniref:Tetratricopeptide repeat protein n=2 Tax=Leptospira santarosai TaxID=28183 RepID=A0A2P1QTW6_9LEPT|nr:Tetratricopeptide repeat protein [Leptospira santarosai]